MKSVDSLFQLEFNALESFITTSPISDRYQHFLNMGVRRLNDLKAGSKIDAIGYLSSCKIRKTYSGKRIAEGVIQDKGFRFPIVFYVLEIHAERFRGKDTKNNWFLFGF